jgi:ribosomal protein L2
VQVSLLQMTEGEAVVHPVDQQFAVGDRVVISPLAAIQDGMQVQLVEGQR